MKINELPIYEEGKLKQTTSLRGPSDLDNLHLENKRFVPRGHLACPSLRQAHGCLEVTEAGCLWVTPRSAGNLGLPCLVKVKVSGRGEK